MANLGGFNSSWPNGGTIFCLRIQSFASTELTLRGSGSRKDLLGENAFKVEFIKGGGQPPAVARRRRAAAVGSTKTIKDAVWT